MSLYVYPGGDGLVSVSPPCVKVDLALQRLGLPFEVIVLTSGKQADRHSPTGRLPSLKMGDETIAESCRILDRLEKDYPESDLWIQDENQRTIDYLWDRVVNDHLYWHGFYLRWVQPTTARRFLEALLRPAPASIRFLAPLILPRTMRKRAMAVGVGRRSAEDVLETIATDYGRVAAAIGRGPFLQGRPTPARGDLALASLVVQAGYHDTLPQVMEIVKSRRELIDHAVAVFEACGSPVPRWIQAERS